MTENQQIIALLTEIRDLLKRPAAAASPATGPAPGGKTISYARLKDGTWGVRCPHQPKSGDKVQVTTKDNKVRTETIDRVVWSGPDRQGGGTVWVCAVVPHTKKENGQPAQSAPAPATSGEPAPEAPAPEEDDVPF